MIVDSVGLANNKGAVDWCLFGRFAEETNKNISASTISQRCSSSCSKIRSSIDFNIKSDPGGFDFCAHNTNANFTADAADCAECLYRYEDLSVLGNVLSTVRDMCEKKPGKNYTIAEGVEVYGAERINLSGNVTAPSASPSSSPSSSPPSGASSSSDDGLSKGAIAGIVLGGLLALIALLGLALFLLKRRKNSARRAEAGKGEELAATSATGPPQYHQAQAGKERFGYAAEAEAMQAPVELGGGRGRSELPGR